MEKIRYLKSSWLVLCDKNFTIIKDGFVVFDDKIIDFGDQNRLQKLYKSKKFVHLGANSVLMPGLVNPHIHLEFAANISTLQYGSFTLWLKTVLKYRDELIDKIDTSGIDKQLDDILKSGTTSIGAISSYGLDMNSCIKSKLKVTYFIEAIGQDISKIDELFENFQKKLKKALSFKSKNFIPAVAIHSPYSTGLSLIEKCLKIAKEKNLPVTAHFLESYDEKQWLEHNSGVMAEFFLEFFNKNRSSITADKFLELFKDIKILSFVHCCYASKSQLDYIIKQKAMIVHCPKSNMLLGGKLLDIKDMNNISLGTDGLSSNDSLNMFDELKMALFMHQNIELETKARVLLYMATNMASKTLGQNTGQIKVGHKADLISFDIENKHIQNLATNIILQEKEIKDIYIDGKKII